MHGSWYGACCRGAEDPPTRDDVGKTLSMAGLKASVEGFVREGKLWPATLMTTQFFQTNRVGACARIKFKHLKLNAKEGMTEPEPMELVEFASVNQKRQGHHRLYKAMCCLHVDPTVCPVWFLAAQLVGMHERMPGILQSVADGAMVYEVLPDFATGGTVISRQPLWWGYSLYPARNSCGVDDPAGGQVSDQAILKHTRGQLDWLPEDERPVNCTHSVRYGGLQNCQTNELTAEQQDKQGGWDPIQRTMKDRYTISIHDRDACLRVSGRVPKNGEPPKQHHVRPRALALGKGGPGEGRLHQGGRCAGAGHLSRAGGRDAEGGRAQIDGGTTSFTALLEGGEEVPIKDGNTMPFLRMLEFLRGVFLAGAFAILGMREGGRVSQLPCFRHPVFLLEHMSLDPARPSWFLGKLCKAAEVDAAARSE